MPALLEEGEWHEVRRHGGRLRRPPAMLEPEGNGANSASGCRGVHEMAASTSGTSGSRSKRERGNDVHKAQGTAKHQVPVKGRGAAKPKPPPLALLISGARVSAKATAFGVGWARDTYGKRYESAELFGTVQRYSDLRAMGEIVQVKWDAGPGFESHDHALHRPDVKLHVRPSPPRPSPTQQAAKKKQTQQPREAKGKPKGVAKPGRAKSSASRAVAAPTAQSKKRPAAVRRRPPPRPSYCAPIYRAPTK